MNLVSHQSYGAKILKKKKEPYPYVVLCGQRIMYSVEFNLIHSKKTATLRCNALLHVHFQTLDFTNFPLIIVSYIWCGSIPIIATYLQKTLYNCFSSFSSLMKQLP